MFLSTCDVYPKFTDELQARTRSGGVLAISAFVIMAGLFSARLSVWLHIPPLQRFVVDAPRFPLTNSGHIDHDNMATIAITFDVFMLHVPCSYLSVQVMDVLKDIDIASNGRVRMDRFDREGVRLDDKPHPRDETPPPSDYCGSCRGARVGCCNTCKEVRRAFKELGRPLPPIASIEQCSREGFLDEMRAMANESCRVYGTVNVHRHPGTLHIGPGDTYIDDDVDTFGKLGVDAAQINLSHRVNHFGMGEKEGRYRVAFDGRDEIQTRPGIMKMYYFVKAVPVNPGSGVFAVKTTAFQNYRANGSAKFPGVFFAYDISPIAIIEESDRRVIEFLVEVSAILGGVFSIASFIDMVAFNCGGKSLPKVE